MDLSQIPDIQKYPLHYVFEDMQINPQNPLEFGVASGRTINYISKMVDCTVYGFDTFEGLPERWRDGFEKGAFDRGGNFPEVNRGVKLVKGLFQDTLEPFLTQLEGDVSFIHIDSDLYSSAKYILNTIKDRLTSESIIVFDEMFNYPGWEEGEYKAFVEFISTNEFSYEWIGMKGHPCMTNPEYENESVAVKLKRI